MGAVSYQWKRGGNAITGATGSTYTLVTADAGANVKATASYTDGQGTQESVDSAEVTVSAPSVTISGTAAEDQELEYSSDLQGTLSQQWKRNGTAITGATNSKYRLTKEDVNSTITVEVSSDIVNVSSVTSGASAAVQDIAPVLSISSDGNVGTSDKIVNISTNAETVIMLSHTDEHGLSLSEPSSDSLSEMVSRSFTLSRANLTKPSNLSITSVTSSNSDPTQAVLGDTITINFTTPNVNTNPTVFMGHTNNIRVATVSGSPGNTWSATYLVHNFVLADEYAPITPNGEQIVPHSHLTENGKMVFTVQYTEETQNDLPGRTVTTSFGDGVSVSFTGGSEVTLQSTTILYPVVFKASDTYGDELSTTQTVSLSGDFLLHPTITTPANMSVTQGDAFSPQTLSGSDNLGSLDSNLISSSHNVNMNVPGTYTVTYSFRNGYSESVSGTYDVTVDYLPPSGTVSVTGTTQESSESNTNVLTANTSTINTLNTLSYTYNWQFSDSQSGSYESISENNGNSTYSIPSEQSFVDKWVTVVVTASFASDPSQPSVTFTAPGRQITNVNDAPVANSQSMTTAEDTAVVITLTSSDVDNVEAELTYTIVSGPPNGSLGSISGNTVIYTPSSNYNGPDSFTFKVNDGNLDSGSGTISLNVTAVNDPPTANDQSGVTTAEDTAVVITLTSSDVDVGDPTTYVLHDPPTNGTLSVDGVIANGLIANFGNQVTYTPNSNFNGSDSFKFKVHDGRSYSAKGTVQINVTPVNDTPTGLTITGTTTVSRKLTADISNLVDEDQFNASAIVYKWLSDGDEVQLVTHPQNTFRLNDNHLNKSIEVQAIYDDLQGQPNVISSATVAIDDDGNKPTISGVVSEGQTLTATTLLLKNDPSFQTEGVPADTFKWKRVGSSSVIDTGETYILTKDDVGQQLTVTVSTDISNIGSRTSDPTATVGDVAPVLTVLSDSNVTNSSKTIQIQTNASTVQIGSHTLSGTDSPDVSTLVAVSQSVQMKSSFDVPVVTTTNSDPNIVTYGDTLTVSFTTPSVVQSTPLVWIGKKNNGFSALVEGSGSSWTATHLIHETITMNGYSPVSSSGGIMLPGSEYLTENGKMIFTVEFTESAGRVVCVSYGDGVSESFSNGEETTLDSPSVTGSVTVVASDTYGDALSTTQTISLSGDFLLHPTMDSQPTNVELYQGGTFTPSALSASDQLGSIVMSTTHNVDTSVPGTFSVESSYINGYNEKLSNSYDVTVLPAIIQNATFSTESRGNNNTIISGSFEVSDNSVPAVQVVEILYDGETASSRLRRLSKTTYEVLAKLPVSSVSSVVFKTDSAGRSVLMKNLVENSVSMSDVEVSSAVRNTTHNEIALLKSNSESSSVAILTSALRTEVKKLKPKIPPGMSRNVRQNLKVKVETSDRVALDPFEELTRTQKFVEGTKTTMQVIRSDGVRGMFIEREKDSSEKEIKFKTDRFDYSSGTATKLSGFHPSEPTLLVQEPTQNFVYQFFEDDSSTKKARGGNKHIRSGTVSSLLSESGKNFKFTCAENNMSPVFTSGQTSATLTVADWFDDYLTSYSGIEIDAGLSEPVQKGEFIRDNYISDIVLKNSSQEELSYNIDITYSSGTVTLDWSGHVFGGSAVDSVEVTADLPSTGQTMAQVQQSYTDLTATDVSDSGAVFVVSDTNDAIVMNATANCVLHFTNSGASLNIEESSTVSLGADFIAVFDHGVAPGANYNIFTVENGSTLSSSSNVKWIRLADGEAFDANNVATYRSSALQTPMTNGGLLTLNTPPSGSVSISNNVAVAEGNTISVDTSGITDAEQSTAELTFSYQWQLSSDNVSFSDESGETNSSYAISSDQSVVDKYVTCVVIVNDGYVDYVVTTPSQQIVNVNDAPTGNVTVSGDPTVSHVLSASSANLADEDVVGAVSYQWKRGGNFIAGATDATYTLVTADAGTAVKVTASYTDGQGTPESVDSSEVTASAASVTLSGTAAEDQTLSYSSDLQGTLSQQWKRNGNVNLGTGLTHTLTQADVGATITVTVSSDVAGVSSVTSGASATVSNVNDAPTGTVTVSGDPTVSHVLSVSDTLADEDVMGAVSYQWKRNGDIIADATASTYTLVTADTNNQVKVTASYTDGQGTPESVDSSEVTASAASVTLSGTAAEDQTLSYSSDLQGTLSQQWKRNGNVNLGTGLTHTLTQADVGATITVTVSSDVSGVSSVTSGASATVSNINDAPTGLAVSGTPTLSYVLTADISNLVDEDNDPDAVLESTVSYIWKRDGVVVSAPGTKTHTLTDADVGKNMSVTVSYTDDLGTPEQITEASIGSVAINVNDTGIKPTISGTVTEGQALLATTLMQGTVVYQWQKHKNGVSSNIGSNSMNYTLLSTDAAHTITVTVSTDLAGVASQTSDHTSSVVDMSPPENVSFAVTLLSTVNNINYVRDLLNIEYTNVVGTDNVAVTHYYLAHSMNNAATPTTPASNAGGWLSFSESATGTYTGISQQVTDMFTMHMWAKDAAGNITKAPVLSSHTFKENAAEVLQASSDFVDEYMDFLTQGTTPNFRTNEEFDTITNLVIARQEGGDNSTLDNLLTALSPNKHIVAIDEVRTGQLDTSSESRSSYAIKSVRGTFTEFMPVAQDDNGIIEGYHSDKPFYFELGHSSDSAKLTVSNLGGINNLPVYNSSTQAINAPVLVNGDEVMTSGWDSNLDMVRFVTDGSNTSGLRQVWFEMESASCGVLLKTTNTPDNSVRVIENWLHKQSTSQTYTTDLALYNETITLTLQSPVTISTNTFVQLAHATTDSADPPEFSAGDIIAEGRVNSFGLFNASTTVFNISMTAGEFVHDSSLYDVVIANNANVKTVSVESSSLEYNLQLYMLVRVEGTTDLKYMPILRDDIKGQKNDMLDHQGLLSLENSADVFAKLVNFGERAETAGDILTPVPIADNNAPLFVIRQNSFTTTGSNDAEVNESSAWGDPFIRPMLD